MRPGFRNEDNLVVENTYTMIKVERGRLKVWIYLRQFRSPFASVSVVRSLALSIASYGSKIGLTRRSREITFGPGAPGMIARQDIATLP